LFPTQTRSSEPPEFAAIAVPSKVVACEPTALPVALNNPTGRERAVEVVLYIGDGQAEFEVTPGTWIPLDPSRIYDKDRPYSIFRSPAVTVPANTNREVRFRAAFHGTGRSAVKAAVVAPGFQGLDVRPDIPVEVTGPRLSVGEPVPDWLASGEPRTLQLHLRNDTPINYSGLILSVASLNPPTDKRRNADGWSVDTSIHGQPWRSLEFSSYYGWYGETDIGTATPGSDLDVRVRLQSTQERGKRPLELQVLQGKCVVAARKFTLDLVATPPPPPAPPAAPPAPSTSTGIPLGALLTAAAAMIAAAAGWWLLRRRRKAKSGHSSDDDGSGEQPV
jgi:hypothetical protein